MKKIRLLYWRMRDAGHRNQVIIFGILSCVAAISLFSFLLFGCIRAMNEKEGAGLGTEAIQERALIVATEAVMVSETEEKNKHQESVFGFMAETEKNEMDLSGVDVFSAYMAEVSLQQLKEQVAHICKERKTTLVKKLEYQKTNEVTYDIVAYILLSDGSVCQCNYNLKSNVLSVTETSLTEEQVQAMGLAEQKTQAEELRRQQEVEKNRITKEKKEQEKTSGKKPKSKNSAKKASGKKPKSKKSVQSRKKTSGKKPKSKNQV